MRKQKDSFYLRLTFYRLLEAGRSDLFKISEGLGVMVGTLRRWKKAFDPAQGPFGGEAKSRKRPESPVVATATGKNVLKPPSVACPSPTETNDRDEILEAMRRQALEGSVPAAKLLLTEIQERPADAEEILTVEKAIELLREWDAEKSGRSQV